MTLRTSLIAALALAAGCNSNTTFDNILGRLVVSNAPIDDIGTAAVGVPTFFTVGLNAEIADVPVLSADVSNLDTSGTVFMTVGQFLDAVPDAQLPEGFTEVTGRVVIGRNNSFDYPFVYWPQVEGYNRADIRFTFTGRNEDETVSIEVRGRGDEPLAAVYPWTVDFGTVPVGETRIAEVTVANQSALPLVVTRSFQDANLFGSQEPSELRIEPATGAYSYKLSYSPRSVDPIISNVVFSVGLESVQTVRLIANDCENGIPAAHDQDGDGYTTCGGDCDDNNRDVNPSKTELPDGADNDCNGKVDDGTRGADDDGDGYCEHPTSCVGSGIFPGDCNDGDDRVNPGESEPCPGTDPSCFDGIDNDCDGTTDGGTDDNDGDGYAEGALPLGDCDDQDPDRFPYAPEVPDGKDNNCNGTVDEGTTLYDDDGDGWCEGERGFVGCSYGPLGAGDCDDRSNPNGVGPHPGAAAYPRANPNDVLNELPDRIDNDCDGKVDESTVFADKDGDGYVEMLPPLPGSVLDCNDSNDMVGPHRLEVPNNGIDDDCDPRTPAAGPR